MLLLDDALPALFYAVRCSCTITAPRGSHHAAAQLGVDTNNISGEQICLANTEVTAAPLVHCD